MEEVIEVAIETADGVADCRLELDMDNGTYNVTILYPHMVNGFSRPGIYTYDMKKENGSWYFEAGEDGVHPKIKKLEQALSAAIVKANA
jgi:hypothetical protein